MASTVELTFHLVGDQFPHAWFFNRFRIDKIGKSRMVTLGLSSEAGGILAVNAFVFTETDWEHNRDRSLKYLSQLADTPTEPSAFLQMAPPPARVYPVNHMSIARVNEISEIGLYRLSVNTLVDKMREMKKNPGTKPLSVDCYPVVMFRAELSIQVTLLKELYA